MANYQNNPQINYSTTLLNQAGGEEYTLGRNTTETGIGNLQPVYDYFKAGLTGDTKSLMEQIQPQADVVGQQFDQVRSMIADQPRGGGKTSSMAQLPVQMIQTISQLLSGARNADAQGAAGVAGQQIQAGEAAAGQGISAAQGGGNLALSGRAQDLGTSFKQNFKSAFGQDLAGSISNLLI